MAEVLLPVRRMKKPPNISFSDTFHVIGQEPGSHCRQSAHSSLNCSATSYCNILGQQVQLPAQESRNRPCPNNLRILSSNVKTMMTPVPHALTSGVDAEQSACLAGVWWEHPSSLKPRGTTMKSLSCPPDTTSRADYQYRGYDLPRNTRRGRQRKSDNPPLVVGGAYHDEADGTRQSFWKENLSFQHQYNCRVDPNYPVAGKRQGHFVWDRLPSLHDDERMESSGCSRHSDVHNDIGAQSMNNATAAAAVAATAETS